MAGCQFAVFDVDFTLHDSALGVDLLLALSRAGLTTKPLETEYAEWQISPDRGQYFMEHFVDVYHTGLRRISKQQMDAIGEQLARDVEQKLYATLRDDIARYRNEGRYICAITQSPDAVMRPLAQLLGFHTHIAPEFHYDDDEIYVGPRPRSEDEKDKGYLLKNIVEQNDLDWTDSTAYGDTLHDLPMLELVEHPVAVNPSEKLRVIALEREWRIIATTDI